MPSKVRMYFFKDINGNHGIHQILSFLAPDMETLPVSLQPALRFSKYVGLKV